jgi:stage III sporulation protein AA
MFMMDRSLITRHFPKDLRQTLDTYLSSDFARCQEIRLRVNRSLSVFDGKESKVLDVTVRPADIKYTFESVCEYSVHSFGREIRAGYITVAGGHRAGFCGTAVMSEEDKSLESIKNISGVNFRIAREVKGAAEKLTKQLFPVNKTQYPPSVLICGGAGSGKTTLLRDTARILGDKYKISLIDCRGELGAVYSGVPAFDIGDFTDIFDGYEKGDGIDTAVRTMSPQIVIADEIGGMADITALEFAKLSGVSVIASIHGREIRDITAKGVPDGMFDYAVFLKGANEPAVIDRIVDLCYTKAEKERKQ